MAPKKFSPKFRQQCVRAVIDRSRTVAAVAREFLGKAAAFFAKEYQ